MIPNSILNEGGGFSPPKLELNPTDIEDFDFRFKEFLRFFDPTFTRSEPRERLFQYLSGLFSPLERKSAEPIALNIENGDVRSMQRFLSDTLWDDDFILSQFHQLVARDLNNNEGVLIFDESGFVKKGKDSAGVSRQYCPHLGKVENCQVGVFAAYASNNGSCLIDKRLFLPQTWFEEDFQKRREKCGIPEELSFKTKPQLACEMLKELRASNQFIFKYVLGDTLYGNSPEFISAIEEEEEFIYFVSVPENTQFWLTQDELLKEKPLFKKEAKARKGITFSEPETIIVKKFALDLNSYCWYRRKVSEGAKGPLEYEFSRHRILLKRNSKKEMWLIIKRTLGEKPQYKYYISNAPKSVSLKKLVELSGMRWPIEQCFEEEKVELGMSHYEVRKFQGWHHHMMCCMLAHFFLWHLKIQLFEKKTVHC